MTKKFICPNCKEKEVEEINACGASNYFCNHCKQLISKVRVLEANQGKESEK